MSDVRCDIGAVRVIEAPFFTRNDGDLSVFEAGAVVPFAIARVFVVRGEKGAIRGMHAHRRCAQLMACTHGAIEVECDDGREKRSFVLDRPNRALLVPASIWAQETYRDAMSSLTVFCDRPYEVEDYIYEYEEFIAYRKEHAR